MGMKETYGVLEMTVYVCKYSSCSLKINPLYALYRRCFPSKEKTDLFKSFASFTSLSFPEPNMVLCTLDIKKV